MVTNDRLTEISGVPAYNPTQGIRRNNPVVFVYVEYALARALEIDPLGQQLDTILGNPDHDADTGQMNIEFLPE
jgi:hypothetical protein